MRAKWIPDRRKLKEVYGRYLPAFKSVLSDMETELKDVLNLSFVPTLKSRVKSFDSYYKKLLRVQPDTIGISDFPVISDNIGIRIICPFLEDLSVVEKRLLDNFIVLEVERKGADRTFREFGYESTHVLLELPERVKEKYELPAKLICEIQIRTILQDAWAEVEHELVYKSEFSPFDLPLKRKLASMNASLSLADIIFQEIRDYQNKLNKEMAKRKESFYDLVNHKNMDLSENSRLVETSFEDILPSSPYVQGTIDDMLLEAIHSHNTGNFDKAVDIYSKIISTQPNEKILTVIYKHRGMAYYAKADYADALEDFKLSAKYDPESYRPYYYIGIVLSTIENYQEAVDYYTKSINLNNFGPYGYFRRAQCWYHLGDMTKAVSDLDISVSLGLSKQDEESLRSLILKKMDRF